MSAPIRRGMGAVTVIVVLVAMATMAAAVLRLGQQSQSLTSQDVQATHATLAARAGLEWALYQTFKGSWAACSGLSTTQDAGNGIRVTLSCDSKLFHEGETDVGVPHAVRVYTLDAIACSSGSATTACPDATAATASSYVERRSQVQAVD